MFRCIKSFFEGVWDITEPILHLPQKIGTYIGNKSLRIRQFPERMGIGRYEITKKRTGNRILDRVNFLMYQFQNVYIYSARIIFYKDRPISAKQAWVRSQYEKRVANYFTEAKIPFLYEKKLILSRYSNKVPVTWSWARWMLKYVFRTKRWKMAVVLHPDFYLPHEDVYVELWGMMHDPQYRVMVEKKKDLYDINGVMFIGLYPDDVGSVKRISERFPLKMQKIQRR